MSQLSQLCHKQTYTVFMNIFKTKEAKRRIAKKDLENEKLPLWKRILALFKIAFTAVGKQD